MKKSKLLGVLGVGILSSLIAVSTKAATVEYPVYDNGNSFYYDNTYNHTCSAEEISMSGGYCVEYIISEDDGVFDDTIRLTDVNNSENTFELNKKTIALGYIVSSDEFVDLPEYGEENWENTDYDVAYLDYDLQSFDGLDENSYYSVMFRYGCYFTDENIPSNISITSHYLNLHNVVNNGIIKTDYLTGNNLTGSGKFFVNYSENDSIGSTNNPLYGTDAQFAYRINLTDSSKIKIDIVGTKIRSGLGLGFFGYVDSDDDIDMELVQEYLDMYNSILGDSLSGYEVALKSFDADYGTYYYGSLEKIEAGKEEKNPNTIDKTMINTIMLISGMIVFVFGTRRVLKKSR